MGLHTTCLSCSRSIRRTGRSAPSYCRTSSCISPRRSCTIRCKPSASLGYALFSTEQTSIATRDVAARIQALAQVVAQRDAAGRITHPAIPENPLPQWQRLASELLRLSSGRDRQTIMNSLFGSLGVGGRNYLSGLFDCTKWFFDVRQGI